MNKQLRELIEKSAKQYRTYFNFKDKQTLTGMLEQSFKTTPYVQQTGSRVWGTERPDSDYDYLFLLPTFFTVEMWKLSEEEYIDVIVVFLTTLFSIPKEDITEKTSYPDNKLLNSFNLNIKSTGVDINLIIYNRKESFRAATFATSRAWNLVSSDKSIKKENIHRYFEDSIELYYKMLEGNIHE